MITMATKYSPSINIKRDVDSEYLYIPTKNSLEAYNTISNNFKAGIHSYNIIGSYGTGKSAFLLAFYKHLNKSAEYFRPVNGQFNGCSKFSFIQVVGSYESIVTSLAKELKVSDDEAEVYEAIKNLQTKLRKKKECLVLVIDEFGKTLEFSAKNNPEKELYFIQRIAEYANDSKRNFLFITTLHQNFDAYAIGLDEKDRKEWEKVKGRIKELPFNEPVEQMLELAGQGLQENFKDIERKSLSKKFFNLIKKSNLFKLRNELSIGTAQKLFPLDPLSASCLLVALQKYGQNERSLFSFISSKEPYGLREHITSSKQSF
jgi:DNA replication protein DnaC